jgi:hypothetical protein
LSRRVPLPATATDRTDKRVNVEVR